MNWPNILHDHSRGYATAADVRKIFADHRDALRWLAVFLVGEKLTEACIVDACSIAERQGPEFHEWLAHWAARATLRRALQREKAQVAELGSKYERFQGSPMKRPPLSAENLQILVEQSAVLAARLDALCRFVLIMHGLAKESFQEVAGQLGVRACAVEKAYGVAFEALHSFFGVSCIPASQ